MRTVEGPLLMRLGRSGLEIKWRPKTTASASPFSMMASAVSGSNPPAARIFPLKVEAFQAGFAPHAEEIVADVANFTNLKPSMQMSSVVVDGPGVPRA